MIDSKLEEMTAKEAVDAGLIEAIVDGSAKISGTYELTKNGGIEYDQNNFSFKDKNNNLRVGRFKDNIELLTFFELFQK